MSTVSTTTLDLKQGSGKRAVEPFNGNDLERAGVRELARDLQLAPGNRICHVTRQEEPIVAIAPRCSADNSALLAPQVRSPSWTQFSGLVRCKEIC